MTCSSRGYWYVCDRYATSQLFTVSGVKTRVCSLSLQDTGISVRKRVIKILRDICLEQPNFSKITEMCVKMIRRVNDEEGIKVCDVMI